MPENMGWFVMHAMIDNRNKNYRKIFYVKGPLDEGQKQLGGRGSYYKHLSVIHNFVPLVIVSKFPEKFD